MSLQKNVENPFRQSYLATSRNFRPDWDVAELNREFTERVNAEIQRLHGKREADASLMVEIMTGPPGYGKTHLFGRIENLVGHDVFFAFVPAFEIATPPLDHIRRHVVDELFYSSNSSVSIIETALARICRPAFADYFADLPPTLAARNETLHHRLTESPDAVMEIVRQVKTLGPFRKLADSMVGVISENAGIVRAFAFGWAPAPWSSIARRWLQGQDLPDADREALGLPEESPGALDVLRTIPAIFGYERPMLICCDQIEGLLQGKGDDAVSQFTTAIMDLMHAVPVQIVLSCFRDQLEKLLEKSFTSFKMRVRQPYFSLQKMTPDQATSLVKARLSSWPNRDSNQGATWPIIESSITQLVREKSPTPRAFIQLCDKEFNTWIEKGCVGEIDLRGESQPPPPPVDIFLQEWKREIEKIRRDPRRSSNEIGQDRLYRGVLEALKLAHSAQRLRDFGGIRIVDIRDKAMKSTSAAPRPGAAVKLAAKPGEESPSVLVALTTLESSRSLTSYFKALYEATADPITGAVLIHPKRDLAMGAKTLADYESAVRAGKIRLLPLEDHPETFYSMECLAAMLERAVSRELVINGVTLTDEDCRDLVLKTGVIDNLDLFEMLRGWQRNTSSSQNKQVSDSSNVTQATFIDPSPPISVTQPIAQSVESAQPQFSAEPQAKSTDPVPETRPSDSTLEGWAAKMLAGAVKKLKLLSQQVEPDGVEVGPTFARLRVRPVGRTNFKGVSNKAVDLRISLGLDVVPIVGSQAGCISIDIQRPDRAIVTLDEALANPPEQYTNAPAFPLGKDVAGESHWLNLANPSDCHLLVAGTTGSGKSEFLRSVLSALATRLEPDQIQFKLIDPKRVTFNLGGSSPYLRSEIAHSLDDAMPLIMDCMNEMERRYSLMAERKLSDVSELPADLLPRIVVIIDEFAAFLEDKESKRIVEALLKRIGAMARAAGIHLILSTQRPDKDVVTPLLRDNLPGRIALRVATKQGSDLIIGSSNAENLLGKGDLFWKRGGDLLRLQSPFVTQIELERALRVQS